MSYFPHAFQKMLLAVNGFHSTVTDTLQIAAGQLAAVNAKTNQTFNFAQAAPSYANVPMIYLAQGSMYSADTLGSSFHGGYKETVKSKGINPRYVSKFYVTTPAEPEKNYWSLCADNCPLPCETTYRLRIDIKGSPVLRTLQRNMYYILDAYTGCCTDPDTPNLVDPTVVLLQFSNRINEYPLLKGYVRSFVVQNVGSSNGTHEGPTLVQVDNSVEIESGMYITSPTFPYGCYVGNVTPVEDGYQFTIVKDGVTQAIPNDFDEEITFWNVLDDTYVPQTDNLDQVNSCMIVEAAYVDAQFGNCSFSPFDKFDVEPIRINLSMVDETGDPCVDICLTPTELTPGYQGKGYGETLVREYILFKRYLQESWMEDPRFREVMDGEFHTDIDRNAKYYVYHILHSVPRKTNPDSTFDNDQYLIKIVTPSRNTNFETWMNGYLANAGSGVQLEVF